MNKTKQNKTKQNKTTTTISLTNLLSFKLFIALLSLILLFAISCSNKGTTGGESGENYYDGGGSSGGDSGSSGGGSSIQTKQQFKVLSFSKTSTIKILNNTNYEAGSVSYLVTPYSLKDYTVSILLVSKATGNTSSLNLDILDFSYDKASKKLTLTSAGLNKVSSASSLVDATAYKYDIQFMFSTTSDTVSNKTVYATNTVSLFKVKEVTKADLTTIIKTIPKEANIPNRSKIDGHNDYAFSIDFSKASGIESISSSSQYVTINNMAGMTDPTNANSTYSPYGSGLTTLQIPRGNYFSYIYCKSDAMTISTDGSSLTVPYIFTLKDGYILNKDISFITNEGLKFKVLFLNKGKWVKDTF